jgi:hypothetical protein
MPPTAPLKQSANGAKLESLGQATWSDADGVAPQEKLVLTSELQRGETFNPRDGSHQFKFDLYRDALFRPYRASTALLTLTRADVPPHSLRHSDPVCRVSPRQRLW